jgi:hypothetical protein
LCCCYSSGCRRLPTHVSNALAFSIHLCPCEQNHTWTETTLACNKDKLELNLDTSLLEDDDTFDNAKFTLVIVAWALVSATFARFRLEFAAEIAVLALDWALVSAKFALVTAKLATVMLENADELAILALCTTIEMVDVAESCADLMPLDAEIEACWSC